MRVPISWLRELVTWPAAVTTEQLASALTRAGLQVERIENTCAELTGPIVVGRVLDLVEESQKNGKTIRWCQVDVGEKSPRGIICGANNFAVGDHVVVSLPGAVLSGGFEISARKTYGHISDGMICAADELGIGEDHSGIIVLPEQIDGRAPTPGDDALDLLQARDEVLEIDVTPDTGYCLSMRGIAREVAQAFDCSFTDPYAIGAIEQSDGGYPVVLESEKCTVFVAMSLSGVRADVPTPLWMQHRLNAAGMRSLGLNIDITNYVMLESGQPLHAYDGDRLSGPIVVRQAREGERLVTLDDVERELVPQDLLITDDSGPIGLAGVMGGTTTELGPQTTSIVLEGAHFDPVTIAGAFRRHKLPSEASQRFARGVDPTLPLAAVRMAARLMAELGGARIDPACTLVGEVPPMPRQQIQADLPARILGAPISEEQVVEVLRASGVSVKGAKEDEEGEWLWLTPPTWRPDLVDPYDYVEEVGRKLGFGLIQASVPRALPGRGYTFEQRCHRRIRHAAVDAGFVELITLPFMSAEDLDRLGLGAEDSRREVVRLANPLADTQPFMRTTLLPGLFAAIARNTSRSMSDLPVVEIGSVFLSNDRGAAPMPEVTHRPSDAEIEAVTTHLPDQPRMLAGVICGDWNPTGWDQDAQAADWRHAVYLAETVATSVGVALHRSATQQAPWHPGRCAALSVPTPDGDVLIGHAGELHPTVVEGYGLPARSCAVEINLDLLVSLTPREGQVRSLSSFPLTKEDVALVVDAQMPSARVEQVLRAGAGELLESIRLFDIYTGPQIGEGKKSLAYALGFRAADRTMTEAEAVRLRQAAVERAAQECGAVQRA